VCAAFEFTSDVFKIDNFVSRVHSTASTLQ
jgi:hypothetical protein